MELFLTRPAPESGLRAPTLPEFLHADKTVHSRIYKLVNEEQWELDEALHEFTHARQDIHVLLGPRLRGATTQKEQHAQYQHSGQQGQQAPCTS